MQADAPAFRCGGTVAQWRILAQHIITQCWGVYQEEAIGTGGAAGYYGTIVSTAEGHHRTGQAGVSGISDAIAVKINEDVAEDTRA